METSKLPTGKELMVPSLPVAPRIVTPLLVGKMLVPALQIPVHPPGSQHELRGHGRLSQLMETLKRPSHLLEKSAGPPMMYGGTTQVRSKGSSGQREDVARMGPS